MFLTPKEESVLLYLNATCSTPDRSGGIDFNRSWADSTDAATLELAASMRRSEINTRKEFQDVVINLKSNRLADLTNDGLTCWITGNGRQLARKLISGATDNTNRRPKEIIFGLHGIRTHAAWLRALHEVGENEGWKVRTGRWAFGYYNVFQFLTPWSRSAKVRWFRETYHDEVNDLAVQLSREEPPSIVAHSFGTYILGNAMIKYDWLRFDKIVLCGSILPVDFPWNGLIERGQVQAVRNEYGVKDVWVTLVRWFVADTGPSGQKGFSSMHCRLQQESFEYDHSEYFEKGHMEAKWIPFLRSNVDVIQPSSARVTRPVSRPWGLYLAYAAILVSLVVMLKRFLPLPEAIVDHERLMAQRILNIDPERRTLRIRREGDDESKVIVTKDELPDYRFFVDHIELDNAGDDKLLTQIGKLSHVAGLDFHENSRITDAGLRAIANLQELKQFQLDTLDQVTDRGVDFLSHLSKLRELKLNSVDITDDTLNKIQNLSLTRLQLRDTRISDRGLDDISKIETIEVLELGRCGITDEGIKYLTKLAKLQDLYIDSTGITDDSVQYLKRLENLENLDLSHTGISQSGFAELSRALKKCKIVK